ncbi:transcription factor bHLH30-like [Canna indica]|uniref:Transcription factor bHLH30-like n=1 Tax=Canna indica TaxID=4628 RepID=A0AAQ3JRX1_9LILI|nr:transcription factor bHLH30-like [Canna indica]
MESFHEEDHNSTTTTNLPSDPAAAFMFSSTQEAAMAAANSSTVLPWPLPLMDNFNATPTYNFSSFFPSLPPLPPPPPPPPAFYHDLYGRRPSLQFAYDGGGLGSSSSDPLGLAGLYMGPEALIRARGGMAMYSSSSPFAGLHSELGKMTPQEIMDAKALAASKSHSEAERRRRERINAHLARLRSLLPSTTKTDKASLLAEVIQHVKELKRQTSEIAEESPLPTETDELTVDAANDEDGRFVVRASLCCDDRSDLLPDLIKALKALKLRTLKAEITTLGGRIKNVLVITGENGVDHQQAPEQAIASIQDALKAVMERPTDEPASSSAVAGGIKRQRTTTLSGVLEHRSI